MSNTVLVNASFGKMLSGITRIRGRWVPAAAVLDEARRLAADPRVEAVWFGPATARKPSKADWTWRKR